MADTTNDRPDTTVAIPLAASFYCSLVTPRGSCMRISLAAFFTGNGAFLYSGEAEMTMFSGENDLHRARVAKGTGLAGFKLGDFCLELSNLEVSTKRQDGARCSLLAHGPNHGEPWSFAMADVHASTRADARPNFPGILAPTNATPSRSAHCARRSRQRLSASSTYRTPSTRSTKTARKTPPRGWRRRRAVTRGS